MQAHRGPLFTLCLNPKPETRNPKHTLGYVKRYVKRAHVDVGTEEGGQRAWAEGVDLG